MEVPPGGMVESSDLIRPVMKFAKKPMKNDKSCLQLMIEQ